MRLANFILANIEPILADWVSFARTITSEKSITILRDHAAEILCATAKDMNTPQTDKQRSDKSKGDGEEDKESRTLDTASEEHAIGRADSGFDMRQLLSEYRALRASVIRLWQESLDAPDLQDIDDLTRFNEAIDQSIMEAVHHYTERVDESREMFLAILGHDLRNPLAGMRLAGDVLGHNKGLDADSLRMVQQIANTTAQMERMILDLLDFAVTRMGQGIRITRVKMNLETLCRSSVAETQMAHPSRIIHCTFTGDLSGEWDSRRLWQMLSNLLGNAMQHGADLKAVDLSVTGKKSDVVIKVHNMGKPIPPALFLKLFDPMANPSDSDRARRPGSVRLGLYIVKEIVTAHEGTVHVTSSRSAGTNFIVRLPRKAAPVPA